MFIYLNFFSQVSNVAHGPLVNLLPAGFMISLRCNFVLMALSYYEINCHKTSVDVASCDAEGNWQLDQRGLDWGADYRHIYAVNVNASYQSSVKLLMLLLCISCLWTPEVSGLWHHYWALEAYIPYLRTDQSTSNLTWPIIHQCKKTYQKYKILIDTMV